MQLNHLKALVAIVDTGSFNSAAAKLGLTQAAISMQIKRLEDWLGFDLFERSVRPPRLNNAGLLLLDQAREIVDMCERFKEFAPISNELRGSIKIGSVTGLSHFSLICSENFARNTFIYKYKSLLVTRMIWRTRLCEVVWTRH